jgi:hypothetical protein
LFGELADGGSVRIVLGDEGVPAFVITPNTLKLEHLSESPAE